MERETKLETWNIKQERKRENRNKRDMGKNSQSGKKSTMNHKIQFILNSSTIAVFSRLCSVLWIIVAIWWFCTSLFYRSRMLSNKGIIFWFVLTEFCTALTTSLPILLQYCYKYCYIDSWNLWAVMKAGGLAL
jgi:hypothetical protein